MREKKITCFLIHVKKLFWNMQCNHELDGTELIMQKQGFVTSQSQRRTKNNRYKFIFPPSLSFVPSLGLQTTLPVAVPYTELIYGHICVRFPLGLSV